jgi:hypothetical protein
MAFTEGLKARVRTRAHLSCCLCHCVGVEVHHIIPQEEGGPDTKENAAPPCPSCHETYGANPTKRKFIREARDFWFEICARRYAADPDRLDRIEQRLERVVSSAAFERFKRDVLDHLRSELSTPRNEPEIVAALDRLWDQVWYNRHWNFRISVQQGDTDVSPGVWKVALESAKRVEKRLPKSERGPWTDFEWGMLNGKLSALRWVLGDDWDFLDT